jgi:hypothetical protein
MIKTTLLLATLLVMPRAMAQPPQSPPAILGGTLRAYSSAPEPALTKFSLDFPGGSPKQLVATIEKAMAKPLNAIIPPEHADVKLPPLKMNNVDVPQLFQALELTSRKTESYVTSVGASIPGRRQVPSYSQMVTGYGFRTQGQLSDESIWYFYVEKPTVAPLQVSAPEKICRYFSLAPYLDRGQSVDDITTAIQTGWKMLGEDNTPKISFHKETRLLIAVGDPERLETIDAVLNALRSAPAPLPPAIDPSTGLPLAPTPARAIPQRPLKLPQSGAGAAQSDASEPAKP